MLGLLVSLELGYKSVKRGLVVAGLWSSRGNWLSWSTWVKALSAAVVGIGTGTSAMWTEVETQGSLEEWDVELWQAMEQDPAIKETLRRMSRLGYEEEEVCGGSIENMGA